MLVIEIYTFMFRMVNKRKNPGSERVADLTPPEHLITLQSGMKVVGPPLFL